MSPQPDGRYEHADRAYRQRLHCLERLRDVRHALRDQRIPQSRAAGIGIDYQHGSMHYGSVSKVRATPPFGFPHNSPEYKSIVSLVVSLT